MNSRKNLNGQAPSQLLVVVCVECFLTENVNVCRITARWYRIRIKRIRIRMDRTRRATLVTTARPFPI